ncbi:transglutaminase-like domain-containing protein [Bosea sp. (in: a-proteobacteria)]|uniref:transglutaminase-like domain-containing protein n=1 Tax=Bosea sp. (in: a-proteobacteria) TaxID=1871050 RepID=UPI002FC95073
MKLKIVATLIYRFDQETPVIVAIEPARSADQVILSEQLLIDQPAELIRDEDPATGARRFRTTLSGQVSIQYQGLIDNGTRPQVQAEARQLAWAELPAEVLPYLLPSRFCPSDNLMRFAQREFSEVAGGGEKVLAVLDWMQEHVDYVHGVSTAQTTAEQTFIDRAGVCRDFAHLGIALCRALNLPARAVSAYAAELDPPDFHAIFEVFLDGRWWLVDPTRLAPIEGIVRIAAGRDAADIAFLTSASLCQCLNQWVEVSRIEGSEPAEAAA